MAPFSGSPKIPNWCERRYLLIVSFVVWPKSQIQNSLLILGHWRINDTTALSLKTRLRYFSHLHILQINILKCCPPPIAWVSPPWAHITSTISVFVPFSSSMFSWSTTQPPVMQLRDIAEKLDESREGHGREREREREGRSLWWKPCDSSFNHKSAGICSVSRKESVTGEVCIPNEADTSAPASADERVNACALRWEQWVAAQTRAVPGHVWGFVSSSSQRMNPRRGGSPLSPPSPSSRPAPSDFWHNRRPIIHTRWKILMDAGQPLELPGAPAHRERKKSGASSAVAVYLCRVKSLFLASIQLWRWS